MWGGFAIFSEYSVLSTDRRQTAREHQTRGDRERRLRKQVLDTTQVAIAGAAVGSFGGAIVAYTTFIAFGLWPAHWENLAPGLMWGLWRPSS